MKSANLSDLCERRRRAGETGIFYDEDTPKAGYVDNGAEWGGGTFFTFLLCDLQEPLLIRTVG